MARASTLTKLPLDRWAQLIGISPLHFNGVYVRAPTVCEQPWLQYAHQAVDRVGREDVALAIAQAESDLESHLGYRLLPEWQIDEWRPTERPQDPTLTNLSVTDLRGYSQAVQTEWKYLVSGGIRSQELVEAGRTITYSDEDGDGYSETATITVVVTFTNACEVGVYYPVAGAVVNAGDEAWRIRPISASISAGTATIVMRREQLVIANEQERLVPPTDDSHLRGVDGAVDANFLATVDVYRVYNDPQRQVQFLWGPLGCSACSGSGCGRCAYSTQEGCLTLRSTPRHSIVDYHPATWNSTDLDFDSAEWAVGRQPELVRLWYYAGWRAKDRTCPALEMDPVWERTVAQYAAALLDRPICECNNVGAWVKHWQRDLAIPGPDESLQISAAQLDNPFGTRRGAVAAWQRLQASATRQQPVGQGVLP